MRIHNNKLGNQILSLLMALVMVISMLPMSSFTAFAADGDTCAETDCTGTYKNGFCSVDATHYEQPTQNSESVYEIGNAGQLFWFAQQVNAGNNSINAVLTADIDLNKGHTFTFIPDTGFVEVTKDSAVAAYLGTGIKGAAVENGNTQFDTTASTAGTVYTLSEGTYTENATALDVLSVWTPIGNTSNQYTGNFDGNDKTVSGLYFNDSSVNHIGLFGYVGEGGTVKSVTVADSYIYGKDWVGGVVGLNIGTVTNCNNGGTIISDVTTGGVVGYSEGDISNSYNTGAVRGTEIVGGVVGTNVGCNITDCYNKGTVSGDEWVGGVAGQNASGGISNSYNTGSVSGREMVGGVAGYNEGSISTCYNIGTISSEDEVGGVAGYINSGSISNCYNTGSVSGTGYSVGGVAGYINSASISNCYNTGAVSGGNWVGGVIGMLMSGSVSNCYNNGTVSGTERVSGVAGATNNNYTATNCYYLTGTAGDGIDGADVAGSAEAKTSEQFASGEVAYLLQGEQTEQVWGQTLGTDAFPNFIGKTVYRGYNSCASDAEVVYTNVGTGKPHVFENGICNAVEGEIHYQPADLVDGIYQIGNAGQLMWFAELVNGGNKTANAVLTDDIDMAGIEWTPICSTGLYYNTTTYTDKGYEGTFDGGGYTISNLKITGTDGVKASYGLFGTLSGTVKNLGMSGMTFSYSGSYDVDTTDARAGAVAGQMLDGSLISDCFVVDSGLTPNNYIVGGIAGCNYAGTIQNCYTKNVIISAHDRCGNLVSDTRGDISTTDRPGTVKNCYTDAGRVVGTNTSGSEYITGCVANILDSIFASGEITYKLNGDRTETVWYQKDGMPAFSGSIVYENLCGGDIFYATTDTDYENHDLGDDFRCRVCGNYDAPEQDANGVYQIATPSNLFWFAEEVNKGNTNINAVLTNDIDLNSVQWMPIGNEANPFKGVFDGQNYKIKNLYIHATKGGNYGVFGYLVDGTVKNFSVSGNAVIELSAQEAVYYGVIGAAAARNADTYVTNVHSTVTMEIKDSFNKNSIAGIVGYAEGKSGEPWYRLYIDRCSFGGSMNFGTAYVDVGGGIAGYVNYNGAVYITNCLYDGTITSEYEGAQAVGGIAGYNRGQNMRIQNCLSVGTIELKNTSYAGAIAGRYLVIGTSVFTGSKVTNNYYSGSLPAFSNTTDASIDNYNIDIVDFTEYTGNEAVSVTDTQLKSGEVTWLLNGESPNGIWKQTIGLHDYPVFEGATVNLNGTTYENTGNYIYVEISWTAMEFTYQPETWNPNTLQYDAAGWVPDTDGTGTVTVKNNGAAVYVSLGYTSSIEGVDGSFDPSIVCLENGESHTVSLNLTGKPNGGSFTDQQIGSVTVTISQTPPAAMTATWKAGDTVDYIGKNGKAYSCYIVSDSDGKYVLLTKEPEIFDAEGNMKELRVTQLEAVGATRYPTENSVEWEAYESYVLASLPKSEAKKYYRSPCVTSNGDRWMQRTSSEVYPTSILNETTIPYFWYVFEVPVS